MLKTAYLGLGKSRYSFAGDGKLVKVGNSNKEEVSQSRPRGKGMDITSLPEQPEWRGTVCQTGNELLQRRVEGNSNVPQQQIG